MVRFLKVLLGVVAFLAVAGGGAWLWLSAREAVPVESDYQLVLDELRQLGNSIPGEKPVAIYSGVGTHRAPAELAPRLRLTREQLGNADALAEAGLPAELVSAARPLEFERVHAAAPGLVLQKAPGHF